jgi:hypothetical protein
MVHWYVVKHFTTKRNYFRFLLTILIFKDIFENLGSGTIWTISSIRVRDCLNCIPLLNNTVK